MDNKLIKTEQDGNSISHLNNSDWISKQTVDTILMNPELKNFRALSADKNNAEELRRYRILMIAKLADSMKYFKGGNIFDEAMIVDFVDSVSIEFPNWKPEDFFLFLEKAKRAEFKTEFEHSISFDLLFTWARKYDGQLLDAIESQRIYPSENESKQIPDRIYTESDVQEELRRFYDKMDNKKNKVVQTRSKEPELWQHVRLAQQKYREARIEYAKTVESPDAHPFRKLAAEQEFVADNPEKFWIENYIEKTFGYKAVIK